MKLPLLTLYTLAIAASWPTWSTAQHRNPKLDKQKPNILFILADQLRFDAIEPWNTPNLYKLGISGARFVSAYSSTPSCTPGRAAILTGLSPWRHGMLGYGKIAKRYKWELPRLLTSSGYTTAAIGKNHFGWSYGKRGEFLPETHGYQVNILYDGLVDEPDQYHQWFYAQTGKRAESGWPNLDMNSWQGEPYAYDERLHPTAWAGMNAVNFIRKMQNASKPWMLKLSFHRPHSPYDPPQRLFDLVKYVSPPILCDPHHPLAWDLRFKTSPECGPRNPDAWCGNMPLEQLYAGKHGYAANVRFVDEWIGKVLRVMKETGQFDNTFLLFTSDHGDAQGDHYLWRKTYPYEISAHIPMIMHWPKEINNKSAIKAGVVIRDVVELRDILPTFMDVIGEADQLKAMQLDGSSLLCFLKFGCKWREWIDLEHATSYNKTISWNALTDGRTKYVFNAYFPEGHSFREQLFNLTRDPYESQDLSSSTSLEAANLLRLWRSRMVRQFESEKRGLAYVKGSKLVRRISDPLYSPHYPAPSAEALAEA